jgi:hypothetical protein
MGLNDAIEKTSKGSHGAVPHGFRVLRLEKDRSKPRMVLLSPLAWVLRLCGRMASRKRWKDYRLDETLSREILMGGNTLIITAEKVA